MLPASLQTPAALVLLAGGVVSCFAGYRVFRVVLGIYGFIIGALFASSAMGTEHTAWMIVGALALAGNRLPIDTAPRSGAWLIYPMNPAPGNYWILAVLVALWITGVIVQLGLTAKGRK